MKFTRNSQVVPTDRPQCHRGRVGFITGGIYLHAALIFFSVVGSVRAQLGANGYGVDISTGGSTKGTYHRKLVSNKFGNWAFFQDANGTFVWSFSADGQSWTVPKAVFGSSATYYGEGAVYYYPNDPLAGLGSADMVYVATFALPFDADNIPANGIWLMAGILDQAGAPRWGAPRKWTLSTPANHGLQQSDATLDIVKPWALASHLLSVCFCCWWLAAQPKRDRPRNL